MLSSNSFSFAPKAVLRYPAQPKAVPGTVAMFPSRKSCSQNDISSVFVIFSDESDMKW